MIRENGEFYDKMTKLCVDKNDDICNLEKFLCIARGPLLTLVFIIIFFSLALNDIKIPSIMGIFAIIIAITAFKSGIIPAIISLGLCQFVFFYILKVHSHGKIDMRYLIANIIIRNMVLIMVIFAMNRIRTKFMMKEKSLNIKSQKLSMLFNNANDAIFLHPLSLDGVHGKFIEVNKKACEVLGYSSDELLNMTPNDLNKDNNSPKRQAIIDRIRNEKEGSFEKIILTKDNRELIFEFNTHLFKWQGQYVALSVARDITKRKKVEMELMESKKRYKELIKLLPDGVFIYDNDEIYFVNPIGAKLLCKDSINEIVNRPIKEVFNEKCLKKLNNKFTRNRNEENDTEIIELEFDNKDETMVYLEGSRISFMDKGRKKYLAVIRDITQRKRAEKLEREIHIKEKLLEESEKYNRLKTEFFANISHELRTPINIILGTVQILEIYIKDDLYKNNKFKDRIKLIKQNCYRLLRLVNNIIDITKIDTGYFDINLGNHDIVKVVKEITLSAHGYMKNKGVELSFHSTIESKIIACDPDKIERILLNLLSNAIKFIENGKNIYVEVNGNTDYIQISVKDNGIGIANDKIDIIFKRFSQVDKSFNRKQEGSGIGLSIVKELVMMHGGNISVDSKEGEGSQFIINLPCRKLSNKREQDIHTKDEIDSELIERINIEFSDIYS